MPKDPCTQCYWWSPTYGCENTNWTTGKLTDPLVPVCDWLSFRAIPVKVVLRELPTGYLSKDAPVTVGKTYEVQGKNGCCLVVSTDVPGETATINAGRFDTAP